MSPSLSTVSLSTGGAFLGLMLFAATGLALDEAPFIGLFASGLVLFGAGCRETRSPRSSRMPRSGDLASRMALVSMMRSPTPAPWRLSLEMRPTRRLGDSMRSRLSLATRLGDVAARLLLDPPSSSSLNARTVIVPARPCG